MNPLFYDTETFSELNIKQVGAAKYARDPSTECLIITWGFATGPVYEHDLTLSPLPEQLREDLNNPYYTKIAHNHPFDRAILKYTQGIEIPWRNCMDSQALAYSMGFANSMEKIQEAMGFNEDFAKLKDGKKLIQIFSKLQPKRNKVSRWTRENRPEDWQRFIDYGVRDTESMREMWNILMEYESMSPFEWEMWAQTQEMNERGIPIDMDLVDTAINLVSRRKAQIIGGMKLLTGLDNPNSAQQLAPWLYEHGVSLPNMQAATLDAAISSLKRSDSLPAQEAGNALQMKRTFGQTAVSKWKSFAKMVCDDDVIRGTITFRGASRTARDASRGINLQNLRRPPKGSMDVNVKWIYQNDLQLLMMMFEEPLDFLAQTVRGGIKAPPGYNLSVSDLSSIESRVLGWLANCLRMMGIFAEGKDTYKDFAVELFNISYDDVTKDQRNFSKPPVLGAGYMMGGIGLAAYAENMGVTMTGTEAKKAVSTFREIYPEITYLWDWLITSVEYTLITGKPCYGYRLVIYKKNNYMFIRLPSGRSIAYQDALWIDFDTPIGNRPSFTYMGVNRFNLKWERIAAHAGGITENIIQAIARDILMEWVYRLPSMDIRLRVHDELVAVTPKFVGTADLDRMNSVIEQPISWAPGLLLKAEGEVVEHYGK
ncbi:MAG: hypothetical protein DRQ47_07495 [Gammaproteobacteria bacterium]|nr:MAG: hypothetical protein DRQ47_07495 [Gammaproteobacteria bacterium]